MFIKIFTLIEDTLSYLRDKNTLYQCKNCSNHVRLYQLEQQFYNYQLEENPSCCPHCNSSNTLELHTAYDKEMDNLPNARKLTILEAIRFGLAIQKKKKHITSQSVFVTYYKLPVDK